MKYKDYFTTVNYSAEDKVLYGKLLGIDDSISFEATDLASFEKEFELAVEDYLEYCKEVGKESEKAYKGSLNIRMHPVLHKAVTILSSTRRMKVNAFIEEAIATHAAKQSKHIDEELYNEIKRINKEAS